MHITIVASLSAVEFDSQPINEPAEFQKEGGNPVGTGKGGQRNRLRRRWVSRL